MTVLQFPSIFLCKWLWVTNLSEELPFSIHVSRWWGCHFPYKILGQLRKLTIGFDHRLVGVFCGLFWGFFWWVGFFWVFCGFFWVFFWLLLLGCLVFLKYVNISSVVSYSDRQDAEATSEVSVVVDELTLNSALLLLSTSGWVTQISSHKCLVPCL